MDRLVNKIKLTKLNIRLSLTSQSIQGRFQGKRIKIISNGIYHNIEISIFNHSLGFTAIISTKK